MNVQYTSMYVRRNLLNDLQLIINE